MNKKINKISILFIIIFIIIIFYIKINPPNKSIEPIKIEKINITEEKEEDIIPLNKDIPSTCITPEKEYDDMFLLNISQTIGLKEKNYIPKNLVELNKNISTRKNICLIEEAMQAFELMAKNALENGNTIKVSSGFRSYKYQESLILNAIKNGKTDTDVSIAKAGYSEHQLGTAIDITGSSINYISATNLFNNTPEELWLRDNAYLYGFIQSYRENKEEITGYKYEPWHYRYIGVDNAKKIKDLDLTIYEFLIQKNLIE